MNWDPLVTNYLDSIKDRDDGSTGIHFKTDDSKGELLAMRRGGRVLALVES